jgi:tRNA A-37 threonylcarbamoyl transferase component Bud32
MIGRDAIVVDGVHWQLSPAGKAALSADDLDLALHIKAGRAVAIKDGQHRAVYRVELANATVYWKHCRLNGPRAWWRDLLRGPKAKLEFDRLVELSRRGIDSIEPLAWGKFAGSWPKGSFLITRALDRTVPLDDYLTNSAPKSTGERRQLAQTIGHYISSLHAAGISHPDFHPGNVLVRDDAGIPRFFLIDVHDTRIGPPLNRRERFANLTLWNRWFRMRATRAERLRFWIAYAGPDASRDDARKLERQTEQSVAQLWESRDSRCLRGNRDFCRVVGNHVDGFALRELDAAFAAEAAADPDALFRRQDTTIVKDSRTSTVAAIDVPIPTVARKMAIKRFHATNWYDPLVNLFRPSPALRSWKNGHAFLARGLPTPRPWLFLERRRFGLATVGYLLCERIENAEHLHEFVATADRGALLALVDRIARWIRVMHERGLSHRDLKAANILVTNDGECWFLDLVGVRSHRRLTDRQRVRDLMRLNASFVSSPPVSRTMRLRFLRTYLLWALRGEEGWKKWWNEVKQATEEKIGRNKRRNRPLA